MEEDRLLGDSVIRTEWLNPASCLIPKRVRMGLAEFHGALAVNAAARPDRFIWFGWFVSFIELLLFN